MRALYDSKSKNDDRGLKIILSEKSKYSYWLKVERSLAKAQAEVGLIPKEAAEEIEKKAVIENFDYEKMIAEKETVGHGFVSFLKGVLPSLNEEGRKYLHYGCTTQNIQQTAQLLQLKDVYKIVYSFLADILENLSVLSKENAYTVMPGRTHGKHAIPITYGYKCSVWISELLSNVERMQESEKRIFQVMMGGAVGSFNSTQAQGRQVQHLVAQDLKMNEMNVPSRNMSLHKIEYLMILSLLCNTFHKMAEEVYYTGIEEFGEVSEGFSKGTVGSSTMPHKINPKLAKGIIANSQKLYSLISPALYSSSRMFEADSSSYMLFDGLLEEATELLTEVLIRVEELTRTIYINKDRMLKNAKINRGLDNSEYIMMKLASHIGKEKAHEVIYQDAIKAQTEKKEYFEVLLNDEKVNQILSKKEIVEMLNPESYIGQSAEIALEMSKLAKKKSKELKGKEYA